MQAIAALETPSGRAPSWLTPVVTRNSVGGLDLYPHSLYWGTPQRAGPKSSDQWCEDRSAMETAKCWLAARDQFGGLQPTAAGAIMSRRG
jgi:hypothetical protein